MCKITTKGYEMTKVAPKVWRYKDTQSEAVVIMDYNARKAQVTIGDHVSIHDLNPEDFEDSFAILIHARNSANELNNKGNANI